jgi:hypothetical protein
MTRVVPPRRQDLLRYHATSFRLATSSAIGKAQHAEGNDALRFKPDLPSLHAERYLWIKHLLSPSARPRRLRRQWPLRWAFLRTIAEGQADAIGPAAVPSYGVIVFSSQLSCARAGTPRPAVSGGAGPSELWGCSRIDPVETAG